MTRESVFVKAKPSVSRSRSKSQIITSVCWQMQTEHRHFRAHQFPWDSPLQIHFRQGFPAMFEASKQIWEFRLKKLLTFEHLWCPHWNRLQQLLLHQPHTSLDFYSYQSAIFVQKISSSENSLYQFIQYNKSTSCITHICLCDSLLKP